MASCIPSCVNVSCPAVDDFMLKLLHFHGVLYKQRQHVREQGRDVTGTPAIKHEMIGTRSLAIIVALCLLSIIPMLVVISLRVFCGISLGGSYHQKLLRQIVYDVAMFVNAICIPLITGWKKEEFRNAFRKILKCF